MKLLLFFILGISNLSYSESFISPARTLFKGSSQYDFYTDYSKTKSYVSENGEATSLIGNTKYELLDFGATFSYGVTKQLEAYGGAMGRYITGLGLVSNEEYSLTRVGLHSLIGGFKYSFKEEDGMQYAIEASYRQAMFSNSKYSGGEPTELALGDDSREIMAGVNVALKTESDNYFTLRAFYRDPSRNLSTEIFSEVDYNIVWSMFLLGIGVENVYSLSNDQFSNNQNLKPQISSGPTLRFNSINRQWTAPYIKSNLAIGKSWRLEFRYTTVLTGNSTDIRDHISFNLIKRKEKSKNIFKVLDNTFKQYRVEALVTKVSKSRKTVMIDKGLADNLKEGMRVDFYHFDYVGGNNLIAYGVALKVGASKSLVKIKKRYSKKRVEEGTVARAGVISSIE